MAGWSTVVRVKPTKNEPLALIDAVVIASRGFEERAVHRLLWPEVHDGNTAAEWKSYAMLPNEVGLTEDDLREEPDSALTLERARAIVEPWTGIVVRYDIPPGAIEPTPTIYGTCSWHLYYEARWCIRVYVEYPSSSDHPSTSWVDVFVERAKLAFEREG